MHYTLTRRPEARLHVDFVRKNVCLTPVNTEYNGHVGSQHYIRGVIIMKQLIAGLLGLLSLLTLLFVIGQTTDASPGTPPNSQNAASMIISNAVSAPAECTLSYTYTLSSGTVRIAEDLVAGSQCPGGCVVPLALPFPVTFYDQTYTSANVSTTGNLQFVTSEFVIGKLSGALSTAWPFHVALLGRPLRHKLEPAVRGYLRI